MKKAKYLIYILAALVPVIFTSCVEEPVTTGEPDLADCYGVYFPASSLAASHELEPTASTTFTFTAKRAGIEDNIIVPLTVRIFKYVTEKVQDDEGKEVEKSIRLEMDESFDDWFEFDELIFTDGSAESTFEVKFPNAEIGTKYEFQVSIDDEQYASKYTQNLTSFSFDVTRVKWNDLGTGKFRDDIMTGAFAFPGAPAEVDVQIQERDDLKGYYRIKNPYGTRMLYLLFAGEYDESAFRANVVDTWFYVNATDPNSVWIPEQRIGCIVSEDGYIGAGSLCEKNGFSSSYYGTMQDGVIKFPEKGLFMTFYEGVSQGMYLSTNLNSLTRIILPGCRDIDYSVKVTQSYAEDGVLPVQVTLGSDVQSIRYRIYEGKIAKSAAEEYASQFAGDKETTLMTESSSLELTFAKTGIYSFVAAIYDEDGKYKGSVCQYLNYVASGDIYDVFINGEFFPTDKYEQEGYSPYNSLALRIEGSKLVDIRLGIYDKEDFEGIEEDVYAEPFKYLNKASSDVLAMVNEGGFYTMIDQLAPGKEYVCVIYAANDFAHRTVTLTGRTAGAYNKVYRHFKKDEAYEAGSKADFLKTWNFYAVDYATEYMQREYVGKVSITDNTEMDKAATDKSEAVDYVDVDGIFAREQAKYGMPDATLHMEYYKGFLITKQKFFGENEKGYYARTVWLDSQYAYGNDNALIGAFVDEGYVAFFSNDPKIDYTAVALNFCADEGYSESLGFVAIYEDMLFVDPQIDITEIDEPSYSESSKMAELNLVKAAIMAGPRNYVETRDGFIRSTIDAVTDGRGVKLMLEN